MVDVDSTRHRHQPHVGETIVGGAIDRPPCGYQQRILAAGAKIDRHHGDGEAFSTPHRVTQKDVGCGGRSGEKAGSYELWSDAEEQGIEGNANPTEPFK